MHVDQDGAEDVVLDQRDEVIRAQRESGARHGLQDGAFEAGPGEGLGSDGAVG